MEETTDVLVAQKKQLYNELEQVGEFRRGSLSENYRKCGKKNCICAKQGHPGHGPQYLWTTTIKGKSYAKGIKIGAELVKYIEEIENYHKFQRLCNEIIKVNEEICDLRPVVDIKDKDELDELKKKLQKHFMTRYKRK